MGTKFLTIGGESADKEGIGCIRGRHITVNSCLTCRGVDGKMIIMFAFKGWCTYSQIQKEQN